MTSEQHEPQKRKQILSDFCYNFVNIKILVYIQEEMSDFLFKHFLGWIPDAIYAQIKKKAWKCFNNCIIREGEREGDKEEAGDKFRVMNVNC